LADTRRLSVLVLCVMLSTSLLFIIVPRVRAPPTYDVDVAVSITPIIDNAIYVFKSRRQSIDGQMRIGNQNANPAIFVYTVTLTRLDNNPDVPDLPVTVNLERTNTSSQSTVVDTTTTSLSGLGSVDVTLTWYEDGVTSGLPGSVFGTAWLISAVASVSSPYTDTNALNDVAISGVTKAYTCPADLTGNGYVDIFDAIQIANAFGSTTGDLKYNPDADINFDGEVDVFDAILFAAYWSQHAPP
jgi:hypothetical protein